MSLNAETARILAEMYGAAHKTCNIWARLGRDTGPSGYAELCIPTSAAEVVRELGDQCRRVEGGYAFLSVPCGGFQSVRAKQFVADAMADSLKKNGIDAFVQTRVD